MSLNSTTSANLKNASSGGVAARHQLDRLNRDHIAPRVPTRPPSFRVIVSCAKTFSTDASGTTRLWHRAHVASNPNVASVSLPTTLAEKGETRSNQKDDTLLLELEKAVTPSWNRTPQRWRHDTCVARQVSSDRRLNSVSSSHLTPPSRLPPSTSATIQSSQACSLFQSAKPPILPEQPSQTHPQQHPFLCPQTHYAEQHDVTQGSTMFCSMSTKV